MSVFDDVHKFNKEVVGIDRSIVSPLHESEAQWLVNAIREEIVEEFVPAYNAGDLAGQIDALIDAIYFAIGGLTRLGLTPSQQEECFYVVHDANMAKAKGRKEGRAVEHDLDAVKPEGWEAPESSINNIIKGIKQ